jgi:hypothetical protein
VSGHDERDDYDDEPWRRRPDPAALVHWPALLLCTFGIIQLGFAVVGCIWLPGALVWSWIDPEFFGDDGPEWLGVLIGTLAVAACVGQNAVIVVGMRRLARFRSYRLVLWAVILSFLPLPIVYCGLVTLPLSVWALFAVLNRDVRARFAAVARGTIIPDPAETPDARAD